jgi:hypothetical protein
MTVTHPWSLILGTEKTQLDLAVDVLANFAVFDAFVEEA